MGVSCSANMVRVIAETAVIVVIVVIVVIE